MNVITNFAHTNNVIAAAIKKLMDVECKKANTFRLSVPTPDDTQQEGTGQYKFEAPVILAVLDTAYAEIVSLANRTTRKDAQIALHDRHRHASGWDDQYDGQDEPEETEQSIESQLIDAIDRAEVVLRYAKHIAAVKQGGAEWLAGFEVDKWVPVPGLTDDKDGKFTLEEVMRACISEVGLYEHIKMGRVQKVRSVVENRLLGFNEWCDQQIHRKGVDEGWKNKCAYARICDIHIHDVPVNTAMDYIGDIVLGSAFNRLTTRLEDAVTKVANSKYLGLAYAIQNEIAATEVNKRNIDKAFQKAFEFLPYSPMRSTDVLEIKASDEWLDFQLDLDVKNAEEEAKKDFRAAMREQAMFNIEKRALEIQSTRHQADHIRGLLAQQCAELYQPKQDDAEQLAKAAKEAETKAKRAAAAKKAAETRARKAAEKAEAAKLKGVHKSSTMPRYNTSGSRH